MVLALLWVVGLATALYAAEKLVQHVTELGHVYMLSAGLLGFLVALGADTPEVTSALLSLARGSAEVGMGVVLGSNIYNLAGLLGLSAIVAGHVSTGPYRVTIDGGANLALTICVVALVLVSGLRVVLGIVALLLLALYLLAVIGSSTRVLRIFRREDMTDGAVFNEDPRTEPVARAPWLTLVLALVAAAFIVAGSDLLVQTTLRLGPRLHLPSSIIGTFVLAVATSLPNTWAAIALARRGHASAAIATTFNSNSINLALGIGLPALFVSLHVSSATRVIDAPWFLGMTIVALMLVATRWTLTRVEGGILLALYGAFVVVRLAVQA